jgi:aminoglycoside/choline kinase family phosphotransferase
MDEAGERAAKWARETVAQKWRRAEVREITPLKGDASTRRFWRASLTAASRKVPATAVVIDLGPDDLPLYARELKLYPEPLPEPPWIDVHRLLVEIGVPVPALYAWSAADRLLMVEDIGSRSLFDAVRANPADTADLLRDAVRELLRFHLDATAKRGSGCVAFKIAYDERLFLWEMRRFLEFGLASIAPGAERSSLEPELMKLAAELGRFPRVFSHRDFHANNLFVQHDGNIRIIDFQDALMAPAAQDLAVLMTTRDSGQMISPALEQRLLDFYFTGVLRRGECPSREDFIRSYELCVLQHALKCIGAFIYLEGQGKRGYAAYLPRALGQARRMLQRVGGEFPRLQQALA